jgi:hypothetical protein
MTSTISPAVEEKAPRQASRFRMNQINDPNEEESERR